MTSAHVRAPYVRVHEAALRANLTSLAAGTAVDARRDAWGHGLGTLAGAMRSVGRREALIEDPADAAAHGLVAMTDATPARGVYGLDGSGVPVMSLVGCVLAIKPLRAGEGVSYGFRHHADGDTRIALVNVGYGQGVLRGLGGLIRVTVVGLRLPVIGRVAMDACVLDIGEAPVQRGDDVVFFGDPARGEPAVTEWAEVTGLDSAELVATCGLHTAIQVAP